MEKLLAGAAVFGLVATSAAAEPRYDRKIEQAAAAIVAAKMGDIRGGFSFNSKPAFIVVPDASPTGSIADSDAGKAAGPSRDGMAPATGWLIRSERF